MKPVIFAMIFVIYTFAVIGITKAVIIPEIKEIRQEKFAEDITIDFDFESDFNMLSNDLRCHIYYKDKFIKTEILTADDLLRLIELHAKMYDKVEKELKEWAKDEKLNKKFNK